MATENEVKNHELRTSLDTAAARKLANTTKSAPQMQGISSRWLLRVLPWVQVSGGVFRVNRRLSYAVGDGRVTFVSTGARVQVVPQELCELPMLRGFEDVEVLQALANRFVQREFKPGDVITQAGSDADSICLIAHGKVNKIGTGKYGDETVIGTLADGDHYSYQALLESQDLWEFTVKAVTPVTALILQQDAFEAIAAQSPPLQSHIAGFKERAKKKQDRDGISPYEVGNINKLYEISDKAIVLPRSMEIVIAQPGLSAANASTQQLDLLASTQSYLQTTIKAPLTVWCSR